MNSRLRQERVNFLLFLGAAYAALMCALPMVTAGLANARAVPPSPARATFAQLTFEHVDRNRDGYVNRREAAGVPGLDAVFDHADRQPDGRLDKVEFARALGMIPERVLAEVRP